MTLPMKEWFLLQALMEIADPFLLPLSKPEALAMKRRELAEDAIRAYFKEAEDM